MSRSLAAGLPVTLPSVKSLAAGLMAVRPGVLNFLHVQACVDGDRLYVTDITSVDGLRAACAAMWDAADRGHSVDGMIVPEFRIA